jgi:hypothetical protein
LKYLTQKGCLKGYGFVIMPNHIHLIIEAIDFNGKKMPHTSLLKFTIHYFLKILRKKSIHELLKFQVDESNKSYKFWQKGSFAYEIFSPNIAFKKLEYMYPSEEPICFGLGIVRNSVNSVLVPIRG